MTEKEKPPVAKILAEKHGLTHEHHKALLKLKKDILKLDLKREGTGQYQNQYLTLEQIVKYVEPLIVENDFVTVFTDLTDKDKPQVSHFFLEMIYVPTGSHFVSSIKLPNDKMNAQGVKSNSTYAKRILYGNILALPEYDDDGAESMRYGDRLKAIMDMTYGFVDNDGNGLNHIHKQAKADYFAYLNKLKAMKNNIVEETKENGSVGKSTIDELLSND